MTREQPTAEQIEALRAFREGNGRAWKSKLNQAWQTGRYNDFYAVERQDLLQQVRNTFGPSWLIRFKLPTPSICEASVCLDCQKLTYEDMAEIVKEISIEVKRRNPLFCNIYTSILTTAGFALEELHAIKQRDPDNDEAEDTPLAPGTATVRAILDGVDPKEVLR